MTLQEMNIQVVKDVFKAAERGDLNLVLDYFADDIDWRTPVINSISVPIVWIKPRHGKAEINVFFKELYEEVTPIEMEPQTFTAEGDRVMVEGIMRGMVNKTGREYQSNWSMAITIRNGKCVQLRHYFDTTDVCKVFSAEMRKAA